MKRLIIALLLVLIPCSVFGAEYYVAQSAAGDGSGSSYANRAAISTFNAGSGNFANLAGDTVYFSGTITTRITPPNSGTSGNYITLDGYQGGTCDPVTTGASCGSAATVTTSESGSYDYIGIYINGKNYITVQDFNFYQVSGGVYANNASNVKVKRCYFDHTYWEAMNANNSSYITWGGANGDGNFMLSCQTTSSGNHVFGTENVSDLIVSYNKSRHPTGLPKSDSENVLALHGTNRALIEYNDFSNPCGGGNISVKEGAGNSDIVIRFNNLYDAVDAADIGISVGYTNNVYIYGNYLHNVHAGMRIKEEVDGNIYLWSNIVNVGHSKGLYYDKVGGSWAPKTGYFYNNTIYGMTGDYTPSYNTWDHAAAAIEDVYSGYKVYIKNNIFSENDNGPDSSNKYQLAVLNGSNISGSTGYNQYYFTGKDSSNPVVRVYPSTYYTVGDLSDNSDWGDPGLTDPANGDFTIANGSAVIGEGTDLSQCFYPVVQGSTLTICLQYALDPVTTDWTTTPPTVNYVVRGVGDYGWDRGAYAYDGGGGGDTTPPTPATWSTQPTADSTSQISMSMTQAHDTVTADEDIEYEFTVSAGSCGSDYGTGGTSQSYTADDKSHTDDGLQTNKCYGYQGCVQDEVPNEACTSTISKYTLAAVPGQPTFSVTESTAQINNVSTVQNGNPSSNPVTDCAVYFASSSPADSNWDGKFLSADGYPTTETWLDCSSLGSITIGASGGGYSEDITFAWEMDSTTAEESAGDDTATAAGGNETLSGGYAVFDDTGSNGDDYYSFDVSSQNIINGSTGTIFLKFRADDDWVNTVTIFVWWVDANNYMFWETVSDNDIVVSGKRQGTYYSAQLTGSQISTGTNYILRYRWNTSAASDHQLTLFNTSLSQLDNVGPQDSLSALSGDGNIYIGNWFETAGSNISIDYVHIYSTYEDNDTEGSYGSPLTSDTYSVQVKARNETGTPTAYGTAGTITLGESDTTAPTPNPATWSTEPTAASTTSIEMVGTTGADPNTISVKFTNDNTDCGANAGTGGTTRDWTETDYTHTDDGLQVNKCYGYTVQMRDSIPNTGTASSTEEVYTLAAVPGQPTLGNETETTIDITANNENGNPASNPTTTFCVTVSSTDSAWEDKYVDTDGSKSDTEVWLTDAQLDAGITVGTTDTLNSGTTYCFEVKAKNGDGIETAWSTEICTETDGSFEPPPTKVIIGGSVTGGRLGAALP